jgi:hypothetical protein
MKTYFIIDGAGLINIDQYKIMLRNVWTTNEDNSKQLEMLRDLRASLNISEEIHKEMEAEIKRELNLDPPVKTAKKVESAEMNILIQETALKAIEIPTQPIPSPPPVVTKSKNLANFKLKKNLTLGKQKYRNKDYETALKFFVQCTELAPEDEEIKFFIKKINLKLCREKNDGNNKKDKSDTLSNPDSVDQISTSDDTQNSSTTPRASTAIPVENFDENVPTKTLRSLAPAAIPVSETEPATENVSSESAKTETAVSTGPEADSKPSESEEQTTCVSCEGSGTCYWCNGNKDCDRCVGSGLIDNEPCSTCGGSGKCKSCSGSGLCGWCKGSGERNNRRINLQNFYH